MTHVPWCGFSCTTLARFFVTVSCYLLRYLNVDCFYPISMYHSPHIKLAFSVADTSITILTVIHLLPNIPQPPSSALRYSPPLASARTPTLWPYLTSHSEHRALPTTTTSTRVVAGFPATVATPASARARPTAPASPASAAATSSRSGSTRARPSRPSARTGSTVRTKGVGASLCCWSGRRARSTATSSVPRPRTRGIWRGTRRVARMGRCVSSRHARACFASAAVSHALNPASTGMPTARWDSPAS